MALLFTEYDVAWNSHGLHWNFSIPRATSYSVNSYATVALYQMLIHNVSVAYELTIEILSKQTRRYSKPSFSQYTFDFNSVYK